MFVSPDCGSTGKCADSSIICAIRFIVQVLYVGRPAVERAVVADYALRVEAVKLVSHHGVEFAPQFGVGDVFRDGVRRPLAPLQLGDKVCNLDAHNLRFNPDRESCIYPSEQGGVSCVLIGASVNPGYRLQLLRRDFSVTTFPAFP